MTPNDEVLQEPRFAGLPLEDEHGAEEAGKQPGRRDPPDNLEDANHDKREVRTLFGVGSDGKTPAANSMTVKPAKEASWQRNRAKGVFAKGEPRYENARDEKGAGERQRVGKLCDKTRQTRQSCDRS